MDRYRAALRTVVAKEAKAYGFALAVWSTGSLLLVERGKPTVPAILVFVLAVLVAQGTALMLAYGSPMRTWHRPEQPEYVWTAFHAAPVASAVLLAWLLAAEASGMWAYFLAPLVALLAYQLLLGLESMLLSAPESASRSDRSL